MKNLLAAALVLCAASFVYAQDEQRWEVLTIPVAPRYDDIFFVNEKMGYAAGGGAAMVYKTINGGKTWKQAGSKLQKYLRSIEFLDAEIGLCGSLDGSLFRTTNGGNTWNDIAQNIIPRPAGVCGLAKADATTIFGVGIWDEPAFLIKSTDKGITWTYKDMSAHAKTLIDVFFLDANHGFATGSLSDEEGGVVLYTADGGESWEEKYRTNHLADRIWKIQTPDSVHFYGAIESYTDETRIIRSKDAGMTWETVIVDQRYSYCQMVGFIDPMTGWTGGRSTLFETRDGGEHWSEVNVGSAYNRFLKVNENTAYLTGSKVYKFSRGEIVTRVPGDVPYDPIHYIDVSPNPTNGKATVKVNFGNPTKAHIYLYSTIGKKLNKVFDGDVQKGERTFQFDISDLPPQEVLVILKTNEGMENARLVKN